jgi:hypothetical protein
MNAVDRIPSLQFTLQRIVCAALAVAITVITTQTIVATATATPTATASVSVAEPQYAAARSDLVAQSDGLTAGSITVAR